MGRHGLTVDNLISADVVTADGQFRKASATDNPDLFWALRAAAATSVLSRRSNTACTRSRKCWAGSCSNPLDQAREVLRFYRDFCARCRDEAEATPASSPHRTASRSRR